MKLLNVSESWKVVTNFGGAELLIDTRGHLQLRGGEKDDEIAAREWISLFMHEAILNVERN